MRPLSLHSLRPTQLTCTTPRAGSTKHPPHPLLAQFNNLLAALLIPLSVPTLQLATPTLLISVLEATLETRIQDAQDAWRGSWDRQHRRALVVVLAQAIQEVQHGLARRVEVHSDGTVAETTWRADEVDIDDVVRGREDAVAQLVAPLLDIARALGVLPASADDSPATPRAQERVLSSPPETPTARTPSRPRPSSALPHITRHSPPRSPAPRRQPDAAPAPGPSTLFAPRPLRAPRPRQPSAPTLTPALPPAPPSPTRTSRSEPLAAPSSSPTPKATPTRPSFLAEVAADRWRSPPPPVCPLSPRRRRAQSRSGADVGAAHHEGGAVRDGEGEGVEWESERERRSTLEVLRRTLADMQARAAVLQGQAVGARSEGEERAVREVEGPCGACGESVREGEDETRTPSRRRTARRLGKTPPRPRTARSSSISWVASSSASASSLDDTVAPSTSTSTRSDRTPRRKAPPLAPCTCARPPPPHISPPPHSTRSPSAARPNGATSPSCSSTAKPRRVRLARARPRPTGADELREVSSGAELSLHSSTDVEVFERAHPGHRARLSAAADPPPAGAPPPPAPAPAPDAASAPPSPAPDIADADQRTSPYTLLLLAHRERLREKLALLERRERDRREAAQGGVRGGARQGAGTEEERVRM